MKSWFDTAGPGVATPRYAIGDPVVHWVDELNTPDSIWYDSWDPKRFVSWWYRGIVIGRYWSCGSEGGDDWMRPGWIYRVRMTESYDEHWITSQGISPLQDWEEHDLKRSPAALRRSDWGYQFSKALQDALDAPPDVKTEILPSLPCVNRSGRVLGAVKGAA